MHSCIICHEDGLPSHIMAKTACSSKHGKVTCKPCLLKWFEHRMTCPLCNATLPIKCCLPVKAVHARRRLKVAQQAVRDEAKVEAGEQDAQVARDMQREELLDFYQFVLF